MQEKDGSYHKTWPLSGIVVIVREFCNDSKQVFCYYVLHFLIM